MIGRQHQTPRGETVNTTAKTSKADFLRSLAHGLDEGLPQPISVTLYQKVPTFLTNNRADWELWIGYFGGRPDDVEGRHSESQKATFFDWIDETVRIQHIQYDAPGEQ